MLMFFGSESEAVSHSGLVWSERWTDPLVAEWRLQPVPPEVAINRLAFTRYGLTRFQDNRCDIQPHTLPG